MFDRAKGVIFIMGLCSFFLIGCGEPMQVNEQLLKDPIQTPLGEEVDDRSEDQYQKAILAANDVSQQVQSGQMDFNDLIKTSKLNKLKEKILEGLNPVLDRFTQVKDKIDSLKAQLQSEIDLLDPTMPQQAKVIKDLNRAIAKLDKANAKIDKVINKVIGKLDELDQKLDKLIDKIDTGNILAVILKMKIRDIKNDEIGSIRDILLNLLMMS